MSCPVDRETTFKEHYILCKPLEMMIDALQAKCENAESESEAEAQEGQKRRKVTKKKKAVRQMRGCDWRGSISEYSAHARVCKYIREQCPLGCEQNILRTDIDKHLTDCPLKLVKCEFCESYLQRKEMEEHLSTEYQTNGTQCLHVIVSCPFRCGFENKKYIVKEHIKEQCSTELVKCEIPGCNEMVPSNQMNAHIEQSVAKHLRLAVRDANEEEWNFCFTCPFLADDLDADEGDWVFQSKIFDMGNVYDLRFDVVVRKEFPNCGEGSKFLYLYVCEAEGGVSQSLPVNKFRGTLKCPDDSTKDIHREGVSYRWDDELGLLEFGNLMELREKGFFSKETLQFNLTIRLLEDEVINL